MLKNIKIVIWDLDETFWHGTLSEDGVEENPENISIIKCLVDKGIMNSICSKNDPIQAEKKLRDMGVWDYFIFPCINWNPKGPQIAKLLDDCSLRAENAVFVDDNSQNLREAQFYNPQLNVLNANSLRSLNELSGNLDLDHERLKQYKILENKKRASQACISNDEFLYSSNIRVRIQRDCSNHIERLLDLINRSNQLNYTKVRINKNELINLLSDSNVDCGYVCVEDDYGEYGIVGFYAIENGVAKHFLFSCRTIGMGVEQFVYAELGFPIVHIVGEVRSELNNDSKPKWINQVKEKDAVINASDARIQKNKLNVLISGGCDLEQLAAYLKAGSSSIEYRFNNGIVRHDNTYYQIGSLLYSDIIKKELIDNLCFIDESTFDNSLFNDKYDVVVFSLLMDYTQNVYVNIDDPSIIVAHGDFDHPITTNYKPEYLSDKSYDYLINHFQSDGRISVDNLLKNLKIIRDNIKANIPLILINGCEVAIDHEWEYNRNLVHIKYNEVVDSFVKQNDNVYLLDMRKIVTSREQLTDNIRHYQRDVYYNMAIELASIINIITGRKYVNSSKNISKVFVLKNKLKKRIYKILNSYREHN